MTPISVYDLDRTITRRATWTPFLLFAARRLAPWRLMLAPLLAAPALARLIGIIDRDRLKEAMHRLLLGPAVSAARLAQVAGAFADRTVATNLRALTLAQIAADRGEGRRIVIATAAHRFYAEAIARRLGVDDLVATRARRNGAYVTPRIDGANAYGAAKQAMLARWLAGQGIDRAAAHIRFHSDHVSDAACFEWADEAVAVTPHAPLRRLATACGWRIAEW